MEISTRARGSNVIEFLREISSGRSSLTAIGSFDDCNEASRILFVFNPKSNSSPDNVFFSVEFIVLAMLTVVGSMMISGFSFSFPQFEQMPPILFLVLLSSDKVTSDNFHSSMKISTRKILLRHECYHIKKVGGNRSKDSSSFSVRFPQGRIRTVV